MRRLISAFIVAGTLLTMGATSIKKELLPDDKEKVAFLNEADDFIDDIAEGLQDRQGDAVFHALHGQGMELMKLRESRNISSPIPEGVDVRDFTGDGSARGLKMRLYRPEKAKTGNMPLLVYFHGGGWTIGSLNSCASFCSALASTGNMIVLAVEYSLAPENPFPTGLMDCVAASEYASSHAAEWGSSPDLVSLGGDSSGGNLALASAIYMQDGSKTKIKSLVLYYPVVKAYVDKTENWRNYSKGYGLDGRLMEAFNESYLFSGNPRGNVATDSHNELVSPADADDQRLAKLPPMLIIGGTRDILYDQGKDFASRLCRLGNSVEYIEFPGAVHLFITVEGQPTAFAKAVALTDNFLSGSIF